MKLALPFSSFLQDFVTEVPLLRACYSVHQSEKLPSRTIFTLEHIDYSLHHTGPRRYTDFYACGGDDADIIPRDQPNHQNFGLCWPWELKPRKSSQSSHILAFEIVLGLDLFNLFDLSVAAV